MVQKSDSSIASLRLYARDAAKAEHEALRSENAHYETRAGDKASKVRTYVRASRIVKRDSIKQ